MSRNFYFLVCTFSFQRVCSSFKSGLFSQMKPKYDILLKQSIARLEIKWILQIHPNEPDKTALVMNKRWNALCFFWFFMMCRCHSS